MNTDQMTVVKQKLEAERKHIMQQMQDLKKADPFNNPDHADDNAAVDTDVREQEGHDLIQAEVATLQERVMDIDTALERIEKGRYGYCSKCGKEIPAGRLAVIPEAEFCVECESLTKK